MPVWLGTCAIAAFVAAALAFLLDAPPATTFHLFFAVGALPLIFGAIIHFVPVLTRSRPPEKPIHFLPLSVQLAGVATPLALAGHLSDELLAVAAMLVVVAASVLLVWLQRRLRTTLGTPHPGARWYGAALLCLFFAVSLVPLWLWRPEWRPALRLFHLHLNTLGFIGLAALGTLPVLLPTVMKRPDPAVFIRVRRDVWPATAGVFLVAAGAATHPGLAISGVFFLAWVVGGNLLAWWRSGGMHIGTRGAAPLVAASAGFIALLVAGLFHGTGAMEARSILWAYVALFLLPLVTGALAYLLPVWRYPGVDSQARGRMADRLAHGGRARALLFLLGGGLLLAGLTAAGFFVTAFALLWFVLVLVEAFRSGGPRSAMRR